jgi:hypothetical protein
MERRLEALRGVRETIEASILPLATSVDGRTFSFQASLHGLELRAGGYVVLEDAGGSRLGQVLSIELAVEEATAIEQPAASAEGATTAVACSPASPVASARSSRATARRALHRLRSRLACHSRRAVARRGRSAARSGARARGVSPS